MSTLILYYTSRCDHTDIKAFDFIKTLYFNMFRRE